MPPMPPGPDKAYYLTQSLASVLQYVPIKLAFYNAGSELLGKKLRPHKDAFI